MRSSTCRRRRTAERALRLFAVGRLRPGAEADLFAQYNRRLRPRFFVTEIADGVGSAVEMKRREAAALCAMLPDQGFLVALDGGGRAPDSLGFAQLLTGWMEQSRPVCFAIGGAEGWDGAVLARADFALSLGAMTWPHLLVRGLLAEQVFRAQAIARGHPYHRAGKP